MVKTIATVDSRRSQMSETSPTIQYRLSDDTFLLLGWTTKSNVSLALPVVTMKARFAHPVISPWFQPRDENLTVKYRNGRTAYFAEKDGTGKIYYPSGRLAAKIVKGNRKKESTRVWVYDSGEVDIGGITHPYQLCAIFDSLGNGVIYDQYMRKRLVYNQTEGLMLDSPIKVPVFWKWHDIFFTGSLSITDDQDESSLHEIEKPDIATVLECENAEKAENAWEGLKAENSNATYMQKCAEILKAESKLEEPLDESIYIDTGKAIPLRVSPVKPIFFRINKYFSLRILSQSNISLSFFSENLHTQLKIGVLYSPYEKLKVTEVDDPLFTSERVRCPFESFPAKSESMLNFKKFLLQKRMHYNYLQPLTSI